MHVLMRQHVAPLTQAAEAAAEVNPAAVAADMDTTVPAAADDADEFSIEEDL